MSDEKNYILDEDTTPMIMGDAHRTCRARMAPPIAGTPPHPTVTRTHTRLTCQPMLTPACAPMVAGPVSAQRWCYACAKQLVERLVYAHGTENNLRFTIIRPYNWIGPRMDYVPYAARPSRRTRARPTPPRTAGCHKEGLPRHARRPRAKPPPKSTRRKRNSTTTRARPTALANPAASPATNPSISPSANPSADRPAHRAARARRPRRGVDGKDDGQPRVLASFMTALMKGEPLVLVNGGEVGAPRAPHTVWPLRRCGACVRS
eukprot:7279811-Prymnesium_polylepis.1